MDVVKTEMGDKKTEIGKMYYKIYKTWMNFIIRFIIPSICLVTFNVLLLREVILLIYDYLQKRRKQKIMDDP